MQIYSVFLYKSNLDSEYKNVFDEYTDYSQYHNFLTSLYETKIAFTTTKSIQMRGGRCELPVSHSALELHDYNYCEITHDLGRSFFFITDIQSLNDSTNPSCRLMLKWDAFTNNYFNMQNGFDDNIITRRTTSGFFQLGNYWYPHYYGLTNKILSESKLENDEYTIFLFVRLSEYVKVEYHPLSDADWTETSLYRGELPAEGVGHCFYIPCFHVKNNKIDYPEQTRGQEVLPIGLYYDDTVQNSFTNPSLSFLNSQYVQEAYFTTLCPYTVRYVEYNSEYFPVNTDSTAVLRVTLEDTETNPYQFICFGSNYFGLDGNLIGDYDTRSISIDGIRAPNRITEEDEFINDLPTMKQYESCINTFPYYYKSLLVGQNKVDLIPLYDTTTFYLDVQKYKSTLNYRIRHHGDVGIPFSTYQVGSRLITGSDSLNAYLLSNSESLKVARDYGLINATLGAFSSLFTGNVGNIVSQGVSVYQLRDKQNAALIDNDNKPNSMSIQSLISSNDIDKLDRIHVYDNYPIDVRDLDIAFYDIHFNGNQYNKIDSVRQNTRYIFDVVSTDNCKLPMIKNNMDRVEIENAYNRGITRWHIPAYHVATPVSVATFENFDKNVINYSNIFPRG